MKTLLTLTVALMWTLSLWAGGKTSSGRVPNQTSKHVDSRPVTSKSPPVGPRKSKRGPSPVERKDFTNSQGVLLKWIEPGTFQMGSPENEPDRWDNEVQHAVTLTTGFWLSDHEVTQGEYQAVMGSNPSFFRGELNRPVETVSRDEAVSYCQRLTDLERRAGRITAQQAYRLPTEAEYEYAARAGTTGTRYGELDAISWYKDNSGNQTHPVKQKAANAWGLYDMLGNVSEWCSDIYWDYPTESVTDPTGGPTDQFPQVLLLRGGSWRSSGSRQVRSAYRGGFGVFDHVTNSLGFRPALSSVR